MFYNRVYVKNIVCEKSVHDYQYRRQFAFESYPFKFTSVFLVIQERIIDLLNIIVYNNITNLCVEYLGIYKSLSGK